MGDGMADIFQINTQTKACIAFQHFSLSRCIAVDCNHKEADKTGTILQVMSTFIHGCVPLLT